MRYQKPLCKKCGVELPLLKFLKVRCKSCGTQHKSKRKKPVSILAGIWGGFSFILIPGILFLPISSAVRMLLVIALIIIPAIAFGALNQDWEIEK